MMHTFGSRSRICSFVDHSLSTTRVMSRHFSSSTIACVPSKHIRHILCFSNVKSNFRVMLSFSMRVGTEEQHVFCCTNGGMDRCSVKKSGIHWNEHCIICIILPCSRKEKKLSTTHLLWLEHQDRRSIAKTSRLF